MRAANFIFPITALAVALPHDEGLRKEPICISDLSIQKSAGGVASISFALTGDDAENLACTAESPDFPSKVITCGESKYRFALYPGRDEEFSVRLYHELGLG